MCVSHAHVLSCVIKWLSLFVWTWHVIHFHLSKNRQILNPSWRSLWIQLIMMISHRALETIHDLSRLERCLGNVCSTKCVFMNVARHYHCILIRFANVSHVCSPKQGNMMARSPKQSNHTCRWRKAMLIVWQQFDILSWHCRGLSLKCMTANTVKVCWGTLGNYFRHPNCLMV